MRDLSSRNLIIRVSVVCILLANFFIFATTANANHDVDNGGVAQDTGWISISAFQGNVSKECNGEPAGSVWGQSGNKIWLSEVAVPTGTYTIDIIAHYGYYLDDCQAIITNISTYENITSTPFNYAGGQLTFEGLDSDSQSITIYAVRLHGRSTPPP